MNCLSDKKSARKYFLEKRLSLSEESRNRSSRLLCEKISSLDEFKKADVILIYYPSRNEPDLTPLAEVAASNNKKIAFPISVTDDCTLSFREVSSISDLKAGAYGIPEPPVTGPIPNITEKSLCIVPGLAFDKEGFRIGYGKGYYDRFLSQFKGISAGAVFNSLVCEKLPTDTNDIPVNIIITETGVTRIK